MIGRLRGEVLDLEGSLVVVDVGGVGYEVTCPESVLAQLVKGTSVELYIRQIFREDGVSLYGFVAAFQRRVFDLLLTVKGCGPRVALSLIGMGEESVAGAIMAQDARVLTRASGVGPKLAERIALELRDKIQEEAILNKVLAGTKPKSKESSDELLDALLSLGYRRSEIEAVASEAREASADVQEQLRHALRMLQK